MKRLILPSLFLFLLPMASLNAQTTIPRMDSVRVLENATLLRNPGAGGFNVPEFSAIDLNQDGTKDLLAWDRAGRIFLPFLNRGTSGQVDYDFAPEYQSAFPQEYCEFVLCRDFTCDGKADLFVGVQGIVRAYQNVSVPGTLSFQLYADTVFTDYGAGPALLYVVQGDIPDFVDVDGDGDLDVLTFDQGGIKVEWHKNMALENTSDCSGLALVAADRCWGNFQEDGFNQNLTLGITCRTAPHNGSPVKPGNHSGSTLAAFDEEADGDYEVVIGDLLYDGLTYAHNAGTPVDAEVDSIDIIFPSYDASVALDVFAAAFFVDVDNDGKKDMLTAPNGTNISVNYDNSWYYKNVDPSNGVLLQRISKNFLTSEMVDVGQCAYPVLFDYNADGLLDLIVGNYSRKVTASNVHSGLSLYENTGTATAPEFTLTSRNYASLTNAFNPENFGLTPAFGDMDADGDKDMMVGDANGNLHYVENTAGPGQVANFPSVTVQYSNIDIGQFAAPAIADVDRDGDLDLVVGELDGTLNLFLNSGTPQAPSFTAAPTTTNWGAVDTEPICCTGFSVPFIFTNPNTGHYDLIVGSENGDLFYYGDFESEGAGAFTLDQANFGEIEEGGRTAIAGGDLDGDNVWDWMVGNVRGGIGFYEGNGVIAGNDAAVGVTGQDWEVFPNPTTGKMHVRMVDARRGSLRLTVLDLQGKSLLVQDHGSAPHGAELDLSGLSSGMYFLRLELNGVFGGVKRVELMR
jgi:hypothetical protein